MSMLSEQVQPLQERVALLEKEAREASINEEKLKEKHAASSKQAINMPITIPKS